MIQKTSQRIGKDVKFFTSKNHIVWKKKTKRKLKNIYDCDDRLRLYETLVKGILLCDSKTRRLSKVIGIRRLTKITKKKLYKIEGTKPFSRKIIEKSWKLLPHIFKIPSDCHTRKAM